MSESRTGRRFRVRLPIKIEAAEGKRQGETLDVSAAGVFIQAAPALQLGAEVRFDITLPGDLLGVERDVEVECVGRVVRVERPKRGEKRTGLACVIDSYRFLRKKSAAAGNGKGRC